MKTGTLAEYAKHRGCTKPYVTRLRQARRLVLVQDGQRPIVDFDASDARIAATAAAFGDRPGQTADDAHLMGQYRRGQADSKAWGAKLLELDYRRRVSELIDAAAAEKSVFEAFRALRNAIERTPKRISGLIVGLTDVREVETIIANELRSTLDAFERPTAEAIQRTMR